MNEQMGCPDHWVRLCWPGHRLIPVKGEQAMRKRWKQAAAVVTAAVLTASVLPVDRTVWAASAAGTPYTAAGAYDVTVPHVIVNQVYGGSDDGNASHSFIELYNQSDSAVDLKGWQLAYRSSQDGEQSQEWMYLELTGTIEGHGYYLVRCAQTEGTDYQVPAGDQEWDVAIHNKGVSVVLLSSDEKLEPDFTGAVTEENRPESYVDLLAVQGNDEEDQQMPPVYETEVSAQQSKKKAVRRNEFTDTDNNAADASVVDYSDPVEESMGPHGPEDGQEPTDPTEPTQPTDPSVPEEPVTGETYRNASFETDAALTLDRTGDVTLGSADPDGGVAEIVAYNADNQKAYVVNGQNGLLDVISVNEDGSLSVDQEIQVRDLIAGFDYGDMTSVAVDTVNDRVVVALQAADYTAAGRIAVLDYDGNLLDSYETGVQPDMITVSGNGKWILTADEGEPRQGYGAGTVDPAGSVTLVNTETGETQVIGFEGFDSAALSQQGVLFNKVDGAILSAAQDLEPEYIALNEEGTTAYVALQEANAIATLDLESAAFTSVKSLGFQDYSAGENSIDLVEDGTYEPASYEKVLGVRMPDGISAFQVNGTTYLATANEGDAREWGDFINETKVSLTDTQGKEAEKVRVLDPTVTAGLEEGVSYLFGSRSFSIFKADTMELVYDSGNIFENKTASYLADWFNSSNDDIEIDSRSAKKGPEPEAVTVKAIGGKQYAFVALERIGGIMVFDVTDPSASVYVNYVNTRDFSADVAGDVAPEGLAWIPAEDSPSGKAILLAACEVSGTVAAYTLSGEGTETPTQPAGAVILYTNDIHCAIDGYSSLAAYRAQLLEDGYDVVTVDLGDAIQGEAIGSITEGAAIVDLMNTVGYDFAVPGNHEFDYGLETFLDLAQNQAQYTYLSSNFVDLRTDDTVFDPYQIVTMDGEEVAFVGISTPETYTKSTPTYFQDENGNYIYSFSEDHFYETIQDAVDSALAEGADRVIAVGHLGIEGTTEGWKSMDVIANTTGIDAFIDAHSHETIEEHVYENKDGQPVLLTSTGTKFENFGVMTLADGDAVTTELIQPEEVNIQSSQAAAAAYQTVQDKIDGYHEELAYLNEKLGTSEVELTINNADGTRRIRNGETNMGDFVADAYRSVTGADIALVNGGGIRASIAAGDVTRKNIMDVNPWNNEMVVIRATGQQILDALEHGARMNPEECGGFLQVSGLTYEIHTYLESPVVTDDKEMFLQIDETKERRVQNVKINGVVIDPEAFYTVAGSAYTLQEAGDGFTMFQGAEVVAKEGLLVDSEMLIQYFTENLDGQVTAEQYGSLLGQGRIQVVEKEQEEPTAPSQPEETKPEESEEPSQPTEPSSPSETNPDGDSADTGDHGTPIWILTAVMAAALTAGGAVLMGSRKKSSK